MKAAIQAAPAEAGIAMANWSWKVVRTFVDQRFGLVLSRSGCLNYLHRLGFVLKRPKKRLLKADAEKRQAFVATYATLLTEAQTTGAKIFFADGAHFRADVDLRSKWVLRGEPALADTTGPRRGHKASYYSVVCLETGELEVMSVTMNRSAETSVAFLQQLRRNHTEPSIVIWDNAPMHRGDPMQLDLGTPDLRLKLVALPAYSPDLTLTRPSGAGHVNMSPPTPAWERLPRYAKRWTTFLPTWPNTQPRSNSAVAPPYRLRPRPCWPPSANSIVHLPM